MNKIVQVQVIGGMEIIMIKTVVVGYGNIGKAAIEAINAAPDFELIGVVSRTLENGELGVVVIV